MQKQKWVVIIGVATILGLALWMRRLMTHKREVASWKPVTVVAVGGWKSELNVSRDGRFLWMGELGGQGQAFCLAPLIPGRAMIMPPEGHDFEVYKGLEKWPRLVRRYDGTHFQREHGAPDIRLPRSNSGSFSVARDEIYVGSRIWNMSDGRLKARVRFDTGGKRCHGAFSPDGRWLILALQLEEQSKIPVRLRRYDVLTGKAMASPNFWDTRDSVGGVKFSPDGRFLLIGPGSDSDRAIIFDTSTWKQLWRVAGIKNADWLPDNSVGLTNAHGLEWRDAATGAVLQSRGGALAGTQFWTTSPNGRWIYASDEGGTIRRWRAK